jgi:uncharacterized GH25 family protein
MPHTKIICVNRNGNPVQGARVSIGFDFSDHMLSSGVTDSEYTDKDGRAEIQHLNTGVAYVYINGDRQDTPINVPGTYSFTI